MTESFSQKIEKFVELLHASALNEEVKQTIIDNAEKLTEANIDAVIESLSKEQVELEKLKDLLEQRQSVRSRIETDIQNETRPVVQQYIDSFVESIPKEEV